MTVREEKTPITDNIKSALLKIDFNDTFATTNHKDSLQQIAHLIFGQTPKWVESLMNLRNYFAKFLGLITDTPADFNEDFKIGGYIGFFKIYTITPSELILGADDKHLNFRVSILDTKETAFNIKTTTLVQYNNKMGKIYMIFVKPFHRIVVKRMVRQAFNESPQKG